MSEAIEALAEAWASLDGKLDEFHAGRAGEDTEGDYHGYLSDAAELAKRLEHRGYVIVRVPQESPGKKKDPAEAGPLHRVFAERGLSAAGQFRARGAGSKRKAPPGDGLDRCQGALLPFCYPTRRDRAERGGMAAGLRARFSPENIN